LVVENEEPNNALLTYNLPADGQFEGERGRYAENGCLTLS